MSDDKTLSEIEGEGIVKICADLLQTETGFAFGLNVIAVLALALAIWLLFERALIAQTKLREAEAAVDKSAARVAELSPTDFKAMADALKGLAAALKDAPASVVLVIVVLAIIYVPSTNVGSPCDDILKTAGTSQASSSEREAELKTLIESKPSKVVTSRDKGKVTVTATWPAES